MDERLRVADSPKLRGGQTAGTGTSYSVPATGCRTARSAMPRQRTHHSRITYDFPEDFPQRLVRFKEESGLSWAKIARRLGTYPHTVKRWRKEGVRPDFRHQMALLDLADDLGLGHIFTDWRVWLETRHEMSAPAVPAPVPESQEEGRTSARRLRLQGLKRKKGRTHERARGRTPHRGVLPLPLSLSSNPLRLRQHGGVAPLDDVGHRHPARAVVPRAIGVLRLRATGHVAADPDGGASEPAVAPSPTGKLWSKNGVHLHLRNEAYTSTLVWGTNAKDKAGPVRVEKAFHGIISNAQFGRVKRLMRSRAPKRTHPRRVGSTYLLSGLVKCKACNRAFSGQEAKSGQFSYYVCQSIMKRGKEACESPRINARRFEEMIVGNIRSNILTEGNIRALVKVVDERMDGVAAEQRKLGRIWHFIETANNVEMTDASDRIREHRDRQERLEASAEAILSQRREVLDDVETITAYAQDMSEFLKDSELTERRAFIETFAKEIAVMPGKAVVRYTVPMTDDTKGHNR